MFELLGPSSGNVVDASSRDQAPLIGYGGNMQADGWAQLPRLSSPPYDIELGDQALHRLCMSKSRLGQHCQFNYDQLAGRTRLLIDIDRINFKLGRVKAISADIAVA
jgi:hypothetical protein